MSIYEHFSEQALEILRARAERAAAVAQTGAGEKPVTALQLWLDSESYALPIEMLRAVYEGVTVVPVPCTPAFVAGIANVRGRILPVLNLAALLNPGGASGSDAMSLVVVSNSTLTVALLVATVGDVTTFLASDLTPLPASTDAGSAAYMRGILPDGTGLLDLNAMLGDPALMVGETFS
jgi:purine-binding chemotaxis protein CheW